MKSKKFKKKIVKNKGITLVALVVTIIVLLILAGVSINLIMGNEGIIGKSETAVNEHEKATATETINFKITNVQIDTYAKEQRMPTLKEVAEFFAEDEDIAYLYHSSKPQASLDWWGADDNYDSIFTILEEYPSYEFEINSSLQLASINGIEISSDSNEDIWSNKNTWEKLYDIGFTLDEIVNNEVVFNKTLIKQEDISYMLSNTDEIMPSVVNSQTAMKVIGNNREIYKYIFGDTEENIDVNSTWVSAILNNSNAIAALDQTNPVTVPNMTTNTSPSGEASTNSYDSTRPPWQAFNSTVSSYQYSWHTADGTTLPAWVCYKFEQPVLIYQFMLQNRNSNTGAWVNAPYDFSIQASNDGENWDILGQYINTNNAGLNSKKYAIQNIKKRYCYYRIYINSAMCNTTTVQTSVAAIGRLQFYGK